VDLYIYFPFSFTAYCLISSAQDQFYLFLWLIKSTLNKVGIAFSLIEFVKIVRNEILCV
jgi:hypothetical protein